MCQTLLELAEMEVEHEKIFENMRQQISYEERELRIFDPENEAALYLQAMASGHVFDLKKDMSKQLTGKESTEDILNMALQAEKDSIAYYVGMQKFVPAPAGKEKVENIIAEEMSHIVVLNEKLAALK
jgi:rubrerythrin